MKNIKHIKDMAAHENRGETQEEKRKKNQM
jgi:hypothetical protein